MSALTWVTALAALAATTWRAAVAADAGKRARAVAIRARTVVVAWTAVAALAATGAYNASRHVEGIAAPWSGEASASDAFGLLFAGKQILLVQALVALVLVTVSTRGRARDRVSDAGLAHVATLGAVAGALVVAIGVLLRHLPPSTLDHVH